MVSVRASATSDQPTFRSSPLPNLPAPWPSQAANQAHGTSAKCNTNSVEVKMRRVCGRKWKRCWWTSCVRGLNVCGLTKVDCREPFIQAHHSHLPAPTLSLVKYHTTLVKRHILTSRATHCHSKWRARQPSISINKPSDNFSKTIPQARSSSSFQT